MTEQGKYILFDTNPLVSRENVTSFTSTYSADPQETFRFLYASLVMYENLCSQIYFPRLQSLPDEKNRNQYAMGFLLTFGMLLNMRDSILPDISEDAYTAYLEEPDEEIIPITSLLSEQEPDLWEALGGDQLYNAHIDFLLGVSDAYVPLQKTITGKQIERRF